jgi:hypothetical protein
MRRDLDGRGVVAMTSGVVATAAMSVPLGGGVVEKIVRMALGVPLVLVLPGHAVLAALRPLGSLGSLGSRRSRPSRQGGVQGGEAPVERWAWTVALSVAVAVLGAFLLDLVPGGLSRTNWLVLLGGTTVLAGAVAVGRGFFDPARPGVDPAVHGTRADRMRVRSWRATATFGVAAVVASAAVWLGVSSAAAVPDPGFAQLWLVAGANPGAAEIGVHSYEERDQRFRLELRAEDGTVAQTWTFPLHPGDEWRQDVELQPGRTSTAELYRGDDPAPYRRVWQRAP